MIKAILELSQYLLAFHIVLYTFLSFYVLFDEEREHKNAIYIFEIVLIFLNHLIAYLTISSKVLDINYLFFFAFQVLFLFAYIILSRTIYDEISKQLLNHVCMLLSIGFVILTRISYDKGIKQFKIVACSLVVALVIPYLFRYVKWIKKGTLYYALAGILALCIVFFQGKVINGSRLSFQILGFAFQPSEFIKILYVFTVAGLLWNAKKMKDILLSAIIAAFHICLLAISKDLGSALIFFIVYVIMLYLATCKIRYIWLGLLAGVIGSYIGYCYFRHVQIRVANWINPWRDLDGTGYQITQSLFAIGTGKWFGMGIYEGNPGSIPYVEQDFIFSAVCEEYGAIFGICLVLICVNMFLLSLELAVKCKDRYLKLIIAGLGITYIFQVFLTIGGDVKFIPLTGVTLPFVSYGGSSVFSSVLLFSIIQGIYLQKDLVIEAIPEPVTFKTKNPNIIKAFEKEKDRQLAYLSAKKQFKIISCFFPVLFISLIGYMIYFMHYESNTVINNAYNNKRQEILASKTSRGDIVTETGDILATTEIQKDGSESRLYPYKEVFSHAIGYSTNGRMGVEQKMNIDLVTSNDNIAEKIQNDLNEEKHKGNTVITTFRPDLQQAAYKALGAYNGAILVTEPSTGKILAMVSKPDFDPNEIDSIWNKLIQDDKSSVLLNRATQGLYPPGSTFKIVTALEYLREYPDSINKYQYQCNGKFTFSGDQIQCYHGMKHGKVDFYQSFAKSCNSSFANMSLQLDRKEFGDTLNSLLFDKELPYAFPYKKSHAYIDGKSSDTEVVQTAIGQGKVQITPLHMAMITNAIANNGILMKPYSVAGVKTSTGKNIKKYEPEEYGRLMTENEAGTLMEMMKQVVEDGTAKKLSGQSYTAAGKTGSAEYNAKSDSHAWFTGFAPAENPQIVVTVIIEGAGSGGDYAVPVARRIFDQYFISSEKTHTSIGGE